jgi:transcriptional regulator with XRE-family HTH domain
MTSRRLPNYLRAHRKRLALTQADVAYLLGMKDGIKVCRYEAFVHEPKLHIVLAYEAICEKPASELFVGRYEEVVEEIAKRAEMLLAKLASCKLTARNQKKRQVLARIVALKSENQK